VPDAAATDAAQQGATGHQSSPHEDLNLRSQVTPYSHRMAGQKIRTLEGHQPTDSAQLDYLEADHLLIEPALYVPTLGPR
jgi:hypothetical protein